MEILKRPDERRIMSGYGMAARSDPADLRPRAVCDEPGFKAACNQERVRLPRKQATHSSKIHGTRRAVTACQLQRGLTGDPNGPQQASQTRGKRRTAEKPSCTPCGLHHHPCLRTASDRGDRRTFQVGTAAWDLEHVVADFLD